MASALKQSACLTVDDGKIGLPPSRLFSPKQLLDERSACGESMASA